jgi:hypothetical protein
MLEPSVDHFFAQCLGNLSNGRAGCKMVLVRSAGFGLLEDVLYNAAAIGVVAGARNCRAPARGVVINLAWSTRRLDWRVRLPR